MDQASYDEALKIAIRQLRVSASKGKLYHHAKNADKTLDELAALLKTDKGLLIARVDDKAF